MTGEVALSLLLLLRMSSNVNIVTSPVLLEALTRSSARRRVLALAASLTLAPVAFVAPPAASETTSPSSTLSAAIQPGSTLDGWDPSYIIADEVMDNAHSMTPAQVEVFLATRGAACVVGSDGSPCMKDATWDLPTHAASAYCDAITGGTGLSSADVIYRVSQACRINPQVLLVTLQKEQGLITTTDPSERRYREATGFRCPDLGTCDPRYAGFEAQVYSAASRYNEYRIRPEAFTFRVGGTYDVAFNPNRECGTGRVTMGSAATAALYNYTPYLPNAAALANPTGTGDECSTYGNRNFFRLFKDWFGAPNQAGSPVTVSPFVDLPGNSVFTREINWMAAQGIAKGWGDGTFRPANTLTRAEFAAFLYRLAGRPAVEERGVPAFPDVPPTHVFYREISWLRSQRITTGWPDGTFGPQLPVLRDQLAAFMYRYSAATASSTSSGFIDVPSTRVFAREIAWMHDQGLTTGYVDGTYRPLEPVLREQLAAFFYRYENRK